MARFSSSWGHSIAGGKGRPVQGNDDASWCRWDWHSPSLGALVAQSCSTFLDPVDCAHQAPLSMGFFRQEYWSGLPFPSPGDLPNPGIKPGSPTLQAESFLSEPPGKPPVLEDLTNEGENEGWPRGWQCSEPWWGGGDPRARESKQVVFIPSGSLHVHCNHLLKFNSYHISKKSEWILARLEMRSPGLRRLEL